MRRESWRDDAARWNARYAATPPAFEPHPLVKQACGVGFPDGPVLELACGRSGSALALAARGRRVLAVDTSDVALRQLRTEAHRRGLGGQLWCVLADARAFVPVRGAFGLVLATLFWDAAVFRSAREAVAPGGLLAWEALAESGEAGATRFRVRPGQLAAELGERWEILAEGEARTPQRHGTCWVLARAALR
ncbi:class I SAM-dependent methyltransferase [Saccharomonospora xinjiangensis]|uniref:Putative methyltransferase n=1 Tax=Saccharomonospora xinjiangensis XJ-54 TaxID=882086 RepID=I0V5U3_9PSEU|nr:class I SAM-dependent methyltransferase [Saccharomonospora xinjiangensis]EID55496.1 putative methyltransferase [Saccharomonospora xinjiangensis XJ-54]